MNWLRGDAYGVGSAGSSPESTGASYRGGRRSEAASDAESSCSSPESEGSGTSEAERGRAGGPDLWPFFQNTAVAITHLYKDSVRHLPSMLSFQQAASAATALYREALRQRRLAKREQRRRRRHKLLKRLIAWTKKRRHVVHRDELLNHLYTLCAADSDAPMRDRDARRRDALPTALSSSAPDDCADDPPQPAPIADLEPFHDALVDNIAAARAHLPAPAATSDADFNLHVLGQISRFCPRKRRFVEVFAAPAAPLHCDGARPKQSRLV